MAEGRRTTVAGWRLLQVGCVLALVALVVMVALPARTATISYVASPVSEPIIYTLTDGSVVSIERVVAVVATIGLEECGGSGLGVGDRLRSVLGVAPALAGHDVGSAPGEIRGPMVLELVGSREPPVERVRPDPVLGSGSAQAWTFCRGHVALGQSPSDVKAGVRAGTEAENLSGVSLRLTGTVTAATGSESFVIESRRSYGGFLLIDPPVRITDERLLTIGFDVDRVLVGLDPTDPTAGDRALEALLGAVSLSP